MEIKEIRKLTGLSQEKFSLHYNIPKRTLEDWERGVRKCPQYVLELLERCVKTDIFIRRVDFEVCVANSDNEPIKGTEHEISVIYNTQIIPEREVEKLINNGMYEYDKRLIITIPERANILSLKGK